MSIPSGKPASASNAFAPSVSFAQGPSHLYGSAVQTGVSHAGTPPPTPSTVSAIT